MDGPTTQHPSEPERHPQDVSASSPSQMEDSQTVPVIAPGSKLAAGPAQATMTAQQEPQNLPGTSPGESSISHEEAAKIEAAKFLVEFSKQAWREYYRSKGITQSLGEAAAGGASAQDVQEAPQQHAPQQGQQQAKAGENEDNTGGLIKLTPTNIPPPNAGSEPQAQLQPQPRHGQVQQERAGEEEGYTSGPVSSALANPVKKRTKLPVQRPRPRPRPPTPPQPQHQLGQMQQHGAGADQGHTNSPASFMLVNPVNKRRRQPDGRSRRHRQRQSHPEDEPQPETKHKRAEVQVDEHQHGEDDHQDEEHQEENDQDQDEETETKASAKGKAKATRHRTEKPILCQLCPAKPDPKTLWRGDHFKRHVENVHGCLMEDGTRAWQKWQCDLCPDWLTRRDNLRTHRNTHDDPGKPPKEFKTRFEYKNGSICGCPPVTDGWKRAMVAVGAVPQGSSSAVPQGSPVVPQGPSAVPVQTSGSEDETATSGVLATDSQA